MLTLIFKSTPANIQLSLNGNVIPCEVDCNGQVVVDVDTFGLHYIELKNLSNDYVTIDKVLLDGCDIRKLLYLSWATDSNNKRHQPCTKLWQAHMTWTLPFVFPLSNWIALADKKITNGNIGKDLEEKYIFYYPESKQIHDTSIPSLIRDFYQHNFDFTVIPKDKIDSTKIPFMKYNKVIPDELIKSIRQEVHDKKSVITDNTIWKSSTNDANAREFNLTNMWKAYWLYQLNPCDMTENISAMHEFPSVKKLIEFLNLDVYHCFIGLLPAGQFIYPHVDDGSRAHMENYSKYHGCTQLYIPIDWPSGSSIKFNGAGILELDSGPMVINADYFIHSAVNLSNQDRFVLGIRSSQDILHDCTFDYK